jgi:hypothetical protein
MITNGNVKLVVSGYAKPKPKPFVNGATTTYSVLKVYTPSLIVGSSLLGTLISIPTNPALHEANNHQRVRVGVPPIFGGLDAADWNPQGNRKRQEDAVVDVCAPLAAPYPCHGHEILCVARTFIRAILLITDTNT